MSGTDIGRGIYTAGPPQNMKDLEVRLIWELNKIPKDFFQEFINSVLRHYIAANGGQASYWFKDCFVTLFFF